MLDFGFQLDSLVYTHKIDHMYTQIANCPTLDLRRTTKNATLSRLGECLISLRGKSETQEFLSQFR